MKITMHEIDSTAVRAIGHNVDEMIVEYNNGKFYLYSGVTASTFKKVLNAESVGAVINAHIKTRYECEQIDADAYAYKYVLLKKPAVKAKVVRADRQPKSGIPGIYWHKRFNKWMVNAGVGTDRKFVGLYRELEDAKKAKRKAARALARG